MKITKIDVMHVRTGLKGGLWRPIVCRVYTDNGLYGDGEAALAFGDAQIGAFGCLQNFAKMIIGMNPLDHETIWDKLYRTSFWGQNGGPLVFSAISAIDIALWDIKGKYYNTPVYQLLGGKRRDKLRAYASQLQFGWNYDEVTPARTIDDYVREANRAVAEGYDCVKYDFFTFKPDEGKFNDLERMGLLTPKAIRAFEDRLSAVRNAVGPDVDIIIENHSFTDANSAIQIAKMAEKYNIFYFEEPCTPTPHLMKYVYDNTNMPLSAGERIYSRWQYIDYFNNDCIQVIQPDVGTCGGITEVKKVCDMAYTFDVGVQVHACGTPISTAAALHIECAIPNFVIHEHHTYACSKHNKELCKYDYQPQNGFFSVPDLPGLGNEFTDVVFNNSDCVTIC